MTYDNINPSHYHGDRRYEPINVIEDWQLNYNLGNALKYISRNNRKPGENPVDGLKKAVWYLQREIFLLSQMESESLYNEILEYNSWNNIENSTETDYKDYTGQAEWSRKPGGWPEEWTKNCEFPRNYVGKADYSVLGDK